MGKGKAKGKHRLDQYYHLAKDHGYRSHTSWKLIWLNSKYNFLESASVVLDLYTAPGGWMQVAVKHVPVGHLIIDVDLVPIAPIRDTIAIQEDITRPECKSCIKKLMTNYGMSDVILHDNSPNIGGAWAPEVYRSQDYSSLLYCLK